MKWEAGKDMKRLFSLLVILVLLTGCKDSNGDTCQIRYIDEKGETIFIQTSKADGIPSIDGNHIEIEGYYSDVLFETEVSIDYCMDNATLFAKQSFPEGNLHIIKLSDSEVSVSNTIFSTGAYLSTDGKLFFSYFINFYNGRQMQLDFTEYLNLLPNEEVKNVVGSNVLTTNNRLLGIDIDMKYNNFEDPNKVDNVFNPDFMGIKVFEIASSIERLAGKYMVTVDNKILVNTSLSNNSEITDRTSDIEELIGHTLKEFYYYNERYYVIDVNDTIHQLIPEGSNNYYYNSMGNSFEDSKTVYPEVFSKEVLIEAIRNNDELILYEGYVYFLENSTISSIRMPSDMLNNTESPVELESSMIYNLLITDENLYSYNRNEFVNISNELELNDGETVIDVGFLENSSLGFYNTIILTTEGRVFASEKSSLLEIAIAPFESANFTEIIVDKNIKKIGFGSSTLWLLTSIGEIIEYNLYVEESERIVSSTYPKEVTLNIIKYNQYSDINGLIEEIYGDDYIAYTDNTLSTPFTKLDLSNKTLDNLYVYID